MRGGWGAIVGAVLLTLSLSACTSATGDAVSPSGEVTEPGATAEPVPSSSEDAVALQRAQAWLDAATLPPGAVRSDRSSVGFTSYTGWPCRPVKELEAFWTISGASVAATANWLMEHPTADLITTAVGPVADDPAIGSAIVGYIPEQGAQEGVVYTIAKSRDGVAVRAEIAALTESAVCPELPDGGTWGAPGQG
jgi:hypothetical protein